MDNVIAWFRDYWPYAVALVVVAIGASFIFRKAGKAYRQHQKQFHAEEAQMRRLVELKKTYYPLTEAAVANAPAEELLEGTALSIQIPLQKQENPEAAFTSLPDAQQLIYVLDVFVSDGSATAFFKESSALLSSRLLPALALIGLHDADERMTELVTMFDENDETTSLDWKKVQSADEAFSAMDLLTKIKLQGAEYIRSHPAQFIVNDD